LQDFGLLPVILQLPDAIEAGYLGLVVLTKQAAFSILPSKVDKERRPIPATGNEIWTFVTLVADTQAGLRMRPWTATGVAGPFRPSFAQDKTA